MNRMAREKLWYFGRLILQFMWNIKTNKNETIIDPIINHTKYQQTNVVQATWMQYLWDLIIKNQGYTALSVMVVLRWILIALWNTFKAYFWKKIESPPLFHEGMNVNKPLKEFETYTESCRFNDNDRKTRELLKHLDNNCATILKKSLNYEDENQLQKKLYYPAFKQQMALLFVTTRIKQREAKLKLLNRDQAEDESITRYCFELMNLENEAFPGADQNVLEAYVHEQLLHGLRNPIVRSRLVNEYGKAGQLQEIVQIAKMYEEEQEEFKHMKKEKERIKKVVYKEEYQTDSSGDDEQKIRRFERRSFKQPDKNNYNKNNNSWDKAHEYSIEHKDDLKQPQSNAIPPKHYNEESVSNRESNSPKKSVTVNEQANTSFALQEDTVQNTKDDQKYYGRCFNCDGKFHNSRMCPFGNKSASFQSSNYQRGYPSEGRRSKSAGSRY